MAIRERLIEYADGETTLEGCLAWDDPMVSPEAVLGLAEELSARQADWQIHAYGGTYRSFTNPHANDAERGVMYNARAASRAWRSVENFLAEVFADPAGA
jgi:dienelactone hydrolase